MPGTVAPAPTLPPYVARVTSTGQSAEGAPASTTPAGAPLTSLSNYFKTASVAAGSSGGATVPTVGQIWPRGNKT